MKPKRDRAGNGTYHLTGPYYVEISRCSRAVAANAKSTNTMLDIFHQDQDGKLTVVLSITVSATGRIIMQAAQALKPANSTAAQLAALSDTAEIKH